MCLNEPFARRDFADYSPLPRAPDFDLLQQLAKALDIPVIMEGRIATPEQAAHAPGLGAWAVCVGSAITRPRWITERFVTALGSSQPR